MRFDKTEKSLQTVAFRVLDFSFVFVLFHQSRVCIHAFNIIFLLLTHNLSLRYIISVDDCCMVVYMNVACARRYYLRS